MLQADAEAQLLGQYALVSYVPGPLARFLDDLRLELTPECNPHAHVTVLPPRPLHFDLGATIRELSEGVCALAPFSVELGEVQIFQDSNVVYMELARGGDDLRRMYESLNAGPLAFAEAFPYHPHLTLAQHLTFEEAADLAGKARSRWCAWRGARSFEVTSLSLVRNIGLKCWQDVAIMPLAAEVPVAG